MVVMVKLQPLEVQEPQVLQVGPMEPEAMLFLAAMAEIQVQGTTVMVLVIVETAISHMPLSMVVQEGSILIVGATVMRAGLVVVQDLDPMAVLVAVAILVVVAVVITTAFPLVVAVAVVHITMDKIRAPTVGFKVVMEKC